MFREEFVLTCQDLFKHLGPIYVDSPKTLASKFPKAHLHALLADLIHMGGLGTPGKRGSFRQDATITLLLGDIRRTCFADVDFLFLIIIELQVRQLGQSWNGAWERSRRSPTSADSLLLPGQTSYYSLKLLILLVEKKMSRVKKM